MRTAGYDYVPRDWSSKKLISKQWLVPVGHRVFPGWAMPDNAVIKFFHVRLHLDAPKKDCVFEIYTCDTTEDDLVKVAEATLHAGMVEAYDPINVDIHDCGKLVRVYLKGECICPEVILGVEVPVNGTV